LRKANIVMLCKCAYCDNFITSFLTLHEVAQILAGRTKAKCPLCFSASKWKILKEEEHA